MVQSISNLAIGSKLKFGTYIVEDSSTEPIIWQILAKNHQGYPSNSVTLLTDRIIDLRGFDAKEPSNSNSDRQNYGNNRYKYSNIRQWLNKSGYPWYESQHSADAPPTDSGMSQPTGYDDEPGFLSNFTEDELGAILDTTLIVALNTVTDGGGSETVIDKVFLLSETEVGLGNENGIIEGSPFSIFTDDASRVSYLTQQAFSNTKSNSKPSTVNDAWYWWLRTPNAGLANYVCYVHSAGSSNGIYAYFGYFGVRPALNLKSDILVSDVPDSDGAYTIIWATPHVITLDKPITINAGEQLIKLHLEAKQAGAQLQLKEIDGEKYIYTGDDLDTNAADIEVDGEDTILDKIAYTID